MFCSLVRPRSVHDQACSRVQRKPLQGGPEGAVPEVGRGEPEHRLPVHGGAGGGGRENVWAFFCERCSDNLHVVLSMSPSGDILRSRCRSFPGLVNNTTIDWIFPWPEQALIAVASVYLAENAQIPMLFRLSIVKHVVAVHRSVMSYTEQFLLVLRRKNYVTPKHYLDFINTYLRLLKEKICRRLTGGMAKIAEAQVQINLLNAKLEKQKVRVAKKTQSREVAEKKEVISVEKEEAEVILAAALPALEAARKALEDLDKNDIVEIRSPAHH
ncbi:Dynein heavy chain, cytoplasmic [Gryllus bimaculatus]|nr:Dynein heavy chain, cytoplasmic [Gryllus bimaculatus]